MIGREIRPSVKALEVSESRDRENLIRILSKVGDSTSMQDIRNDISSVKSARKTFELSSKSFSDWHLRNGSYEREREIRSERISLVYSEARATVQALNQRLLDMGLEIESSIGSASICEEGAFPGVQSWMAKAQPVENQLADNDIAQINETMIPPIVSGPTEKLPFVCERAVANTREEKQDPFENSNIKSHVDMRRRVSILLPRGKQPSMNNDVKRSVANLPLTNSPGGMIVNTLKTADPFECRSDFGYITPFGTENKPNELGARPKMTSWSQDNQQREDHCMGRNCEREMNKNRNSDSHGLGHSQDWFDRVDHMSRRQMKQDLQRGIGEPFSGSPLKYWNWKSQMVLKLRQAGVDPLESMYVLLANTSDRPNSLVNSRIHCGACNPGLALNQLWETLDSRYGSSERVTQAIVEKIKSFPSLRLSKDLHLLEDLLELCRLVLANMSPCPDLFTFDLPTGMRMVLDKLPDSFSDRWQMRCFAHKQRNGSLPRFEYFVKFFGDYVEEQSMPGFSLEFQTGRSQRCKVLTSTCGDVPFCAIHGSEGHNLEDCKKFLKFSYDQKIEFIRDSKLCYKCLRTGHLARDCAIKVACGSCGRDHLTALHRDPKDKYLGYNNHKSLSKQSNNESYKSENPASNSGDKNVGLSSYCSHLCDDRSHVRICSKIFMVDIRVGNSIGTLRCLAILDDQSNCTLVDPCITDHFQVASEDIVYDIKTASGIQNKIKGNRIFDLQIKGVSERRWIDLPPSRTNPFLPDCKDEIANPRIVSSHEHIRRWAKHFTEVDDTLKVLVLVGADCGEAMGGRYFGNHHPYVFKSPLGWSLIGPSCLRDHDPQDAKCLKIVNYDEHHSVSDRFPARQLDICSKADVFKERVDDDELDISKNDREFLKIMADGGRIAEGGHLQFPLPLMSDLNLKDNKQAVYNRTMNTLARVKRNPEKLNKCLDIMQDYILKDQVERVPNNDFCSNLINYIPVFPVEQGDKIRLVFDSSAKYGGTSLNDCLLQGPDDNNRIIGVLTRFRLGTVGYSADIERMFHSFLVHPEHHDLMRFYWWDQNDPSNKLVSYRSKVHVFGNKCSPAIATYGLRLTTLSDRGSKLLEASSKIRSAFYVDDLLAASDSPSEAATVLKQCIQILGDYNLRLRKICSSSQEILSDFPESELARDVESISFDESSSIKALGLRWLIRSDTFSFKISLPAAPFTRRGILSTVNRPFDPLGIIAPVILGGRLLQREIIQESNCQKQATVDWDQTLSDHFLEKWRGWILKVSDDVEITMPRSFYSSSFGAVASFDLHVFCDASAVAIGVVMYLRAISTSEAVEVSFLYGCSKLAHRSACSIPRNELCAAVEASLCAHYMIKELGVTLRSVNFYSDSKVVLGYINNKDTRFSKYVTARVEKILKTTNTEQWKYVATAVNPADAGTRPMTPQQLQSSVWLTGPSFLRENTDKLATDYHQGLIVQLPEAESAGVVLSTKCQDRSSFIEGVMQNCGSWKKVLNVVGYVLEFIHGIRIKIPAGSAAIKMDPETEVIRYVQKTCFPDVIRSLQRGDQLSDHHNVSPLCPFLDNEGIMRVGGRLRFGQMDFTVKHPILLPQKHRMTQLIVHDCHQRTFHQGGHITAGEVQQAGFHIHKGTKVIKQILTNCIICKKLRGPLQTQLMADLPVDRISQCAPFTYVGVDVFGPYTIYDGQTTRRKTATKKVYGLLFTCLYSRAIHIEPLMALDISSFRLSFRRFVALRGPCKKLRSDQGTNFVGTRNQMLEEIGNKNLEELCCEFHCVWQLNIPGASHAAGVWERKIGSFKRIFDGALTQMHKRHLSREELYTLFTECAAIVNKTPLYMPSTDPNDPIAISPQMLLTLKATGDSFTPEELTKDDLDQYGARRWKRVSYLAEQFWIRHRRNYTKILQERSKWRGIKRNPMVGDIVLIKTPSSRVEWPIARIVAVKPSADGLVRSVTLKLSDSTNKKKREITRCIQDTVLLVQTD